MRCQCCGVVRDEEYLRPVWVSVGPDTQVLKWECYPFQVEALVADMRIWVIWVEKNTPPA